MDESLKQRLLGAIVIVGLVIIFLPAILDKEEDTRIAVTMQIPERPEIVKNIDIDAALSKQQAVFDQQTIEQPEGLVVSAEEINQQKPSEMARAAKQQADEAAAPEPKPEPIPDSKPDSKVEPAKTANSTAPEVLKQTEEVKSKKTPVSKPKEQWIVQLGSFSKQENAEKLKAKLSKSYSNLYIENVTIAGGRSYRLRLGNFSNKDVAIQQRRQIKTQYGIAGVVMAKE